MTRKRVTDNDVVASSGAGAVPTRRKASTRSRAKHTPVTEPEVPETSAITPTTDVPADLAVTVEVPVSTETIFLAVAPAVYEPSREEIALQAYLYWEERGCQGGSAEEDWVRAETELRRRNPAVVTA